MATRFEQDGQQHILLDKEELIAMEESDFRLGRPLSDYEKDTMPNEAEIVVDPGKEESTTYYLSQIGINILDITSPGKESWSN